MKKALAVCNLALISLFSTWKQSGNGTEAVALKCSVKKVFLEIAQNSQENTCARIRFSIKLLA